MSQSIFYVLVDEEEVNIPFIVDAEKYKEMERSGSAQLTCELAKIELAPTERDLETPEWKKITGPKPRTMIITVRPKSGFQITVK